MDDDQALATNEAFGSRAGSGGRLEARVSDPLELHKDVINQLVASQRTAALELRRLAMFTSALRNDHVELQMAHCLCQSKLATIATFLFDCKELQWLHLHLDEILRVEVRPSSFVKPAAADEKGEQRPMAADAKGSAEEKAKHQRMTLTMSDLQLAVDRLREARSELRRNKGCQTSISKISTGAGAGSTTPRGNKTMLAAAGGDDSPQSMGMSRRGRGGMSPGAGSIPSPSSVSPAERSIQNVPQRLQPKPPPGAEAQHKKSLVVGGGSRGMASSYSAQTASNISDVNFWSVRSSQGAGVSPMYEALGAASNAVSTRSQYQPTNVSSSSQLPVPSWAALSITVPTVHTTTGEPDDTPPTASDLDLDTVPQIHASAHDDRGASKMQIGHETVVTYFVEDMCALAKAARDEFIQVAADCSRLASELQAASASACGGATGEVAASSSTSGRALDGAVCVNMNQIHAALAHMQAAEDGEEADPDVMPSLNTLTTTWNVLLGVLRQINSHVIELQQQLVHAAHRA